MTARQRADRLLVERGLFDSRARAQAAIAAGLVTADGVPVRKASDATSRPRRNTLMYHAGASSSLPRSMNSRST